MKRSLLLFAAVAVLAAPYQSTQTSQDNKDDKKSGKKQEQTDQKKEPAPLFGGQIGVRSSQKSKESATLGFNGIDPSGKVDKRMLSASAGAKDTAKVRNMDTSRPTRTELAVFLRAGELKTR
jgi:hypothetical protein